MASLPSSDSPLCCCQGFHLHLRCRHGPGQGLHLGPLTIEPAAKHHSARSSPPPPPQASRRDHRKKPVPGATRISEQTDGLLPGSPGNVLGLSCVCGWKGGMGWSVLDSAKSTLNPHPASGCYQPRPAEMPGAQHALSSCDHQVCAGKQSGSLNAPIRRGAAGGTHRPLQSDKINFQEAKTTREDRTRPRGGRSQKSGDPLQTQIFTGARAASRSASLDSQAQSRRGWI